MSRIATLALGLLSLASGQTTGPYGDPLSFAGNDDWRLVSVKSTCS